MKLYVLTRRHRYHDEAVAFVVRAKSPRAARRMASQHCGDEGPDKWMDTYSVTCKELRAEGKPKIIVRDYLEA